MKDARDSGRFHIMACATMFCFDVTRMNMKMATRRVGKSFVVESGPATIAGCGEMTCSDAQISS